MFHIWRTRLTHSGLSHIGLVLILFGLFETPRGQQNITWQSKSRTGRLRRIQRVLRLSIGSLLSFQLCNRAISSEDSCPMLAKTSINFPTMHLTNGLLTNMQTRCLIFCVGILTIRCCWKSLLSHSGSLQSYDRHLRWRKCTEQQKCTVNTKI